jgi:hypothetical protein
VAGGDWEWWNAAAPADGAGPIAKAEAEMSARARRSVLAVVLGAVALVLPLVGLTPSASALAYHYWTLSGVTFDDGGTLSGTLIIADDGTPYSADMTTAGGNTAAFGSTHYTGAMTRLEVNGHQTWYVWAPGFGQYVTLGLPDTTSAQEGDPLPLPTYSYECTNCASIRFVATGDIVKGGIADLTPPDISATVNPPSPDGDNGWYRSDVTVGFTVTDPETSVTSQTGCDTQVIDTDTDGLDIECQATSSGGDNSSFVHVRRDATPPTFHPALSQSRVLLDGPLGVEAHATDALSGVVYQSCRPPATDVPGAQTTTCQARDAAGNIGVATVPYAVEYRVALISVRGKHLGRAHGHHVQHGHRMTVTIALTDAWGRRIPDAAAKELGCRVSAQLSGVQSRHGCFTYDERRNQFNASWKLGRKTGAADLVATVTYPNSTVESQLTRHITISK